MQLRNKKVVITGGAGFIGSQLVDELLEENVRNIVIYDDFSSGFKGNIEHMKGKREVSIIEGDILNFKLLSEVMRDIDIVFHLAAMLEIPKILEDPVTDLNVNALGTLNVLRAAYQNGVEKIIYASSAGCYGQCRYLPIDESHPLRPQWPYGVSKLAGEKYCIMFHELYGLSVVALRYGIVYGPREWFGRVMTIFTKKVLENESPIIFGDGNQSRDFVHVRDAVRATVDSAKSENVSGQALNIGSGNGTKIKDLANMILRLSGKDSIEPKFEDPKPGEKGRKPGELKHLVLDIEKARRLLDFEPKIKLESGIEEYINWFSKRKEIWWETKRAKRRHYY